VQEVLLQERECKLADKERKLAYEWEVLCSEKVENAHLRLENKRAKSEIVTLKKQLQSFKSTTFGSQCKETPADHNNKKADEEAKPTISTLALKHKICDWKPCGKTFSTDEKNGKMYCSKECVAKHTSSTRAARRRKAREHKTNPCAK
jgi:hypothetical protein